METVRLPRGTIVKLNGFPCELAEDAYVISSAIAGMGLEVFLQMTEEDQGEDDSSDHASTSEAHS
jgi:hypothetical protein